MKNKGFAIILVLATLVLLAMLSLTYIKLALIDRNIARNYMDNKRAKLIAQSGVEYAIARMQEINPFDPSWQYKDELNPSFVSGSISINGTLKGYSQVVGSTYGTNRDVFMLKVDDASSRINVNDGLDNDRVRDNTKRILNALGDILGITTLGDRIINARSQGYGSIAELTRALNNTEFENVKDFVTTHAWQDDLVANPVPLSLNMLTDYPVKYNENIGVYRYGRGIDAFGQQVTTPLLYYYNNNLDPARNAHGIYGLDELNPQWIEIAARSPVNINHAKEQVLTGLIKDLRGIFSVDRKFFVSDYSNVYGISAYPEGQRPYDYSNGTFAFSRLYRDEVGLLYSTEPPTQAVATNIAKAIIACREERSETIGGIPLDYTDSATTKLWFRGQFKTWRQFNAFIDDLVEKGLIRDSRETGVFYDHYIGGSAIDTYSLKIAHQAKADALKANFNPNLHLNETNPDANIAILVDKTDLIVNSTEFCLTPMGYFYIESEGFILRPNGSDNNIIASSNINVIVKIYDAIRQTNQKQFLAGQIPTTTTATNNGRVLETGPEPAMADQASATQNEWGGYIALPTMKGQPSGAGIVLRGHYTDRFSLDYHVDTGNEANLTDKNAADKTETAAGPYVYDSENRLARSYRQGDAANPASYAPAELRIDGAYIERHAGLAYTISSNVLQDEGIFCYWVKPWFHPENTDSMRTFLTLNYHIGYAQGSTDPFIETIWFGNFFIPTFFQNTTSLSETEDTQRDYDGTLVASYYCENSFIFGYSYPISPPGIEGGRGKSTRGLNHLYHRDEPRTDTRIDYLKRGQWIHIICSWDFSANSVNVLINNTNVDRGGVGYLPNHSLSMPMTPADILDLTTRLRIGESSMSPMLTPGSCTICSPCYCGITCIGSCGGGVGGEDPNRNRTSDSTIDEFYFFTGTSTAIAQQLYTNSRYLKPSTGQSYFTSGELQFKRYNGKRQPEVSAIPAPSVSTSGTIAYLNPPFKIIGLSWTWYPEEVVKDIVVTTTTGAGKNAVTTTEDYRGKAIIKNYKDYDKTQSSDPSILTSTFLYPEVKVKMIKNGTELSDEYKDDGFSSAAIELTSSEPIQYKVIINIPDTAQDTLLLYSPIFDDITIYYTSGMKFLNYSYLD